MYPLFPDQTDQALYFKHEDKHEKQIFNTRNWAQHEESGSVLLRLSDDINVRATRPNLIALLTVPPEANNVRTGRDIFRHSHHVNNLQVVRPPFRGARVLVADFVDALQC